MDQKMPNFLQRKRGFVQRLRAYYRLKDEKVETMLFVLKI